MHPVRFLYRNGPSCSVLFRGEWGSENRKKMSKKTRKIVLVSAWLLLLLLPSPAVRAQRAGLKTNLLSAAVLDANVGVEAGLSRHWSLDVTAAYNAWPLDGHKWKHLSAQPEARYWFCDRFMGHFVGIHGIGGIYNFGNIPNGIRFLGSDLSMLTDRRYEGWAVGAGVAYGYSWILNRRWSLEAEIGAGWIHTRFDEYECGECGELLRSNVPHNYFGPTKAAVNLVYYF